MNISEVLEWRQADAEEILYNLGFVQSEPEPVSRVPARFFSSPSRANGIDFQVFLKAQVQRMEMEDPCLMLASRFQQVQALAATADRISPSRLAWPCPHVPSVPIAPPPPTVLSPVERLKKAVATMCLYTSPREEDSPPRGTHRTPAVATSQPSALGKVVQEVLERAREDRFRFEPPDLQFIQEIVPPLPWDILGRSWVGWWSLGGARLELRTSYPPLGMPKTSPIPMLPAGTSRKPVH
uniref:ITPR-interacting domain-containing protein n=1 Tax=Calidris pygmaea TaxID=425635 RepID=A0A8C3J9H6_9CHAR